jgi:DNA polymerase
MRAVSGRARGATVAPPERPGKLLDAIAAEIREHVPCGFEICEQATNLVPGEGSATAPVVIVGEAPGANEDAQGRPFVGRAGAVLDDLLRGAASRARRSSSPTWSRRARRQPRPARRRGRPPPARSSRPSSRSSARAARAPRPPRAQALRAGMAIGEVHGHVLQRDGRTLFPMYHPAAGAAQPAPHDDAGRRRAGPEAGAVKPIRLGCSGWNYADWRGVLYPPGCPQRKWLARYAEVFDTVEINNTFYRLPTVDAVRGWVPAVAAGLPLRREVQPLPDPHQAPDRHGQGVGPPARAPRAADRHAQDGPDALAAAGQLPPRRRAPRLRARAPARRGATPSSSATRAGSPTTCWPRCAPTASRSSSATTPSARGSPTS